MEAPVFSRQSAVRFIVFLGTISLFADMVYEGARSINGPFLEILGASGTVVGVVAGFGELVGYSLRWLSGYVSDRSHRYWAIMIAGYLLNLLSVPVLAWAGYWQVAVIFMITERAGKAIRNPTRDAMLSRASSVTGHGWGFGLHEFMDQLGATFGPLAMAAVLFYRQDNYRLAYLLLFIPAFFSLGLLLMARKIYPHPRDLPVNKVVIREAKGYPPGFFLYAAGAMCLAAGYADFPLIAFHFKQMAFFGDAWIPALYALAMLTEGVSSLVLGRIFDRLGGWTIVGVTGITLCFAPMVFMMNFGWAIPGMVLWGLGMGTQGTLLKAQVAGLVPQEKRATIFGLFDTFYGVAWFAGSALMGWLYDRTVLGLVLFSMAMQGLAMVFVSVYLQRFHNRSRPGKLTDRSTA